jgi:hypothetical protein
MVDKGKKKPKLLGPDELLAEAEEAPDLNRRFYSADSVVYFAYRHLSLMVMADLSIDPGQFLDGKQLVVGNLRTGPGSELMLAELRNEDYRRRYLITEAAALLHHFSETILRIYLAHERKPRCPWLEISRERSFSEFKKKVRARVLEPADGGTALRRGIAEVFFGTNDPQKFSAPPDPALFAEAIENLEHWLQFFAREFLENANLYNTVKHGLAVQPGDASMQLLGPNRQKIVDADGPAVSYLEDLEVKGRRRWVNTTHWLNLEQMLLAVSLGAEFLNALWEIARMRYTQDGGGRAINLFLGSRFDDFLKAGGEGIIITKMSRDLGYYLPPPKP